MTRILYTLETFFLPEKLSHIFYGLNFWAEELFNALVQKA